MFGLKWLIDHGALPKARLEEYYASYPAETFAPYASAPATPTAAPK